MHLYFEMKNWTHFSVLPLIDLTYEDLGHVLCFIMEKNSFLQYVNSYFI